jgi:hypothetical protein
VLRDSDTKPGPFTPTLPKDEEGSGSGSALTAATESDSRLEAASDCWVKESLLLKGRRWTVERTEMGEGCVFMAGEDHTRESITGGNTENTSSWYVEDGNGQVTQRVLPLFSFYKFSLAFSGYLGKYREHHHSTATLEHAITTDHHGRRGNPSCR